ncbi:hypothetical protein BJV74DRAFT_95738 [Russula compacta]|nr:hypothetical protein BJV74DRAFT_95738 [Russula compacta]
MGAHRGPSIIPRWETLSDPKSSSPSRSGGSSDSEDVDLSPITPISKRKATVPPVGSLRPQKSARPDTSRLPGMTVTETEESPRMQSAFVSRASVASPITKKRKVLLTRNHELLHSLLKPGSGNTRQNNVRSSPRNAGLSSAATQLHRPGNGREIIELLSDVDDAPLGNASNPIVLDSEDEAEPILSERASTNPPVLDAPQSISRLKNLQPTSPSGLTRSRASWSGSLPDVSNTRDENMLALGETFPPSENVTIAKLPSPRQFRETDSSSTQILLHSPYSDMHTADQPPAMDDNTDQMPSPSQNSSEVQDNVPNTVSEPMRGKLSPIPSSLSPTSSKLRSQRISYRLAMARISSSPSRGHDLSADASDSSHVPVRGTLYSGPSGLWKDFFRVATSEPGSPSVPSRGVEKQSNAQPEDASSIPCVNSSCDISSSTLVTLAQNMSIRTSPRLSTVAGRVSLEISDNPTITTDDSASSLAAGEPFGSITS